MSTSPLRSSSGDLSTRSDDGPSLPVVGLRRAAHRMHAQPDLPATIACVLEEAGRLFPGHGLGLQLSVKGVLRTVAATESSIWSISEGSDLTHDGPEHAPLWKDGTCRMISIVSDHHWPRWGARVSRLGWRSLLSVRLTASDPESPVPRLPRTIGALTLYSHSVSRWSREIDLLRLFAVPAESALARAGALARPHLTRLDAEPRAEGGDC